AAARPPGGPSDRRPSGTPGRTGGRQGRTRASPATWRCSPARTRTTGGIGPRETSYDLLTSDEHDDRVQDLHDTGDGAGDLVRPALGLFGPGDPEDRHAAFGPGRDGQLADRQLGRLEGVLDRPHEAVRGLDLSDLLLGQPGVRTGRLLLRRLLLRHPQPLRRRTAR